MKATRTLAYCALMASLLTTGDFARAQQQGSAGSSVVDSPSSTAGTTTVSNADAGRTVLQNVTGEDLGYAFGPTLYFNSQLDDGLGYTGNLYQIESLTPWHLEAGTNVLYLLANGAVTDQGKGVTNFGALYRHFAESHNRIYGGAVLFDIDNGSAGEYQRFGAYLETLGKYWDMRLNGYWVTGNENTTINSAFTGLTFNQNFLVVNRQLTTEHAFSGGDFEVGGSLPHLGAYGFNGYTGLYYWRSAESDKDAFGWSVRGELQVTEDVTLNANFYNDRIWGKSAYATISLSLPDGKPHRFLKPKRVQERLRDRVLRQPRVQTDIQVTSAQNAAINPADGLPYYIVHVDPDHGSPGSGTFSDPYGTMNDLMNPAIADIIYVRGRDDGTGTNLSRSGPLTLLDRQRLLSASKAHTVVTTQGPLVLPVLSSTTPIISNSTNNSISPTSSVLQLANFNEVTGFTISGTNAAGTDFGQGIIRDPSLAGSLTDYTITCNTFNQYTNAVVLPDYMGTGIFDENTITGTASFSTSGFSTSATSGNALGLSIQRNTASNNLTNSIAITASGGATITANTPAASPSLGIISNTVTTSGTGIRLDTDTGGTILASANSNSLTANSSDTFRSAGFRATADTGTITMTEFNTNTINNNGSTTNAFGGDGAIFDARDTGTITLTEVSGNTVNGNAGHGLVLNGQDSGTISAAIGSAANTAPDNIFNGNGGNASIAPGNGIHISAKDNASIFGTIVRNQANGQQNGGHGLGIFVDQTTATAGSLTSVDFDTGTRGILENDFSNNTGSGIRIDSQIAANSAFDVRADVRVDIRSNTINTNTQGGITTTQSGLNYIPPGVTPTFTPDSNRLFLTIGGAVSTEDVNDNDILDPGEDIMTAGDGILDRNDTNLIRNNGVAGISVQTAGTSLTYLLIENNHIRGTTGTDADGDLVFDGGDAIRLNRLDDSLIKAVDSVIVGEPAFRGGILSNRLTSNQGDGVHITARGGAPDALMNPLPGPAPGQITHVLLQDNLIQQNQGTGAYFETFDDAFLNVHARTNTIMTNSLQGVLIEASSNSTFGPQSPDPFAAGRALFDGNTIFGNQRTGLDMTAVDRGRILVDVFGDAAQSTISQNGTLTAFDTADTNYTFALQHLMDPTLADPLPTGRGRSGIRFNTNGGLSDILIRGGSTGQLVSDNGNTTVGGNGVELNFANMFPDGTGQYGVLNSTVRVSSTSILRNINGTAANATHNGDGIQIAIWRDANPSILIGGPTTADGNIIQANQGDGVSVGYGDNSGQSTNPALNLTNELVIRNNLIGSTANPALGNGNHGINIRTDLDESVLAQDGVPTTGQNRHTTPSNPVIRVLDNAIGYNTRRGISIDIQSSPLLGNTRRNDFTINVVGSRARPMILDVERNLITSNGEEGIFYQLDPRFLQNREVNIPNIRDAGNPAAPILPLPYDPTNPAENGADFSLYPILMQSGTQFYGPLSGYFNRDVAINTAFTLYDNSIVNNGQNAGGGNPNYDGVYMRIATNSYASADFQRNQFDGNAGNDIRTVSFNATDVNGNSLNPLNGVDNTSRPPAFDQMILDDGAYLDMRMISNTGDSGFSTQPNPEIAVYTNADPLKVGPQTGAGYDGLNRVVMVFQMDDATAGALNASNTFTKNGSAQDVEVEIDNLWFRHIGADALFPNALFPPPVAPFIAPAGP